ncbi:histone-lysine N-methyltransferase SETMAR-like [Haliotis rufescens]|uniref:histone-lysine N-methyltransferase SETMAR-like n=1 Tax=Haliotis rufescens TaxID=6454 RepID=UPI00201F3F9D|nr:histone-lysine N-methyltransferase SETMAR-like [Haliotis rufescens]
MVQRVLDIFMDDRRVTQRQIANLVDISQERVHFILTDILGMHKVSARWVPKLLTADQKPQRENLSRENLKLFEGDPDNFLKRFVTMDETWVHHFELESKQQSKQWKHVTSPTPKKAKSVPSAGKVMASVFWDSEGVIMVDWLPKGCTVTGAYYVELLRQLREKIKVTRRGKLTKGGLYHHDNAPAHTSLIAMAKIHECGFELLQHPPYSPDLAPSDYHLFPQLKRHLAGTHFQSDDDVITAVNNFLSDQEVDLYKSGIMALQHCWQKCVDLKGDYVEK